MHYVYVAGMIKSFLILVVIIGMKGPMHAGPKVGSPKGKFSFPYIYKFHEEQQTKLPPLKAKAYLSLIKENVYNSFKYKNRGNYTTPSMPAQHVNTTKNYQFQTKIFKEKISSVNHLVYQYLYSTSICF